MKTLMGCSVRIFESWRIGKYFLVSIQISICRTWPPKMKIGQLIDDTTVHYASKNKTILGREPKMGSNGFLSLCLSNNMHVHVQETSLMWIGTWQNLQQLDSFGIFYLDDELIKQVDTQKLLGLTLDSTLSWDEQISVVCLNLTRRISLLKQLSKYVNMESLK